MVAIATNVVDGALVRPTPAPAARSGGEPIRVAHVISGLGTGGAENFLLRLVSSISENDVQARVISLTGSGSMVPRFRKAGVELVELGLVAPAVWRQLPQAGRALRRTMQEWQPHIIQGWMNHGNVAAWLARLSGSHPAKLLWSVRQTVYDVTLEKPGTRAAIRLQSWLSSRTDGIVFNSRLGLQQHSRLGFRNGRMEVIPNGFDVQKFRPRPDCRQAAREQLGCRADELLVGMIARNHPMKDYRTFLEAVAIATAQVPGLRAVCVGGGLESADASLAVIIRELGLDNVCTLLEEQAELEFVYPGLDILCLTSAWGEGFPNVIGEAMSCGIPCIATDIGDTASVIGDAGWIVQPRRPRDVAAAIVQVARMSTEARRQAGVSARERVINEYSMRVIAARYLDLYDFLVQGAA